MASLGTLVTTFTANTGNLLAGIGRASKAVTGFARSTASVVSSTASGVSSMALGVGGALVGIGTIAGGYALKLAADAEKTQVALEVLLGSVESANRVVTTMRNLAVESPFDAQQLIDSTKVMVQFGQDAETSMRTIEALSKVAVGDAQKLDALTLAMSQSAAAGRLMGQDLLQMINAGFNPLFYMSQRTGVSMKDLRKEMEKGNITFAMVQEELTRLTTGTGRFADINKRLTGTLSGQWQKFIEQLKNLARMFGEAILPGATLMLKWVNDLIPAVQLAGRVLIKVFQTIGLSIQAMWETAKDYTKATLEWMANAAIQVGRNIAEAIQAAFRGENPMGAMMPMPAFKVPDLGPAGKQLAKELESLFAPAVQQAVPNTVAENLMFSNVRMPKPKAAPKLAEAMFKGSAEAYSAIVRSRGGGNPVTDAINSQTQALLDPLNAIAKKDAMPIQVVEAIA